MGDTILFLIPSDTHWQPKPAQAKRARSVVERLMSMEDLDEVEIELSWHNRVSVVGGGEYLTRITCPHCTAGIDTDWWNELLSERFDLKEGFSDLTATLPCCGRITSLIDLEYDSPFDAPCVGFARFDIAIWNPERDPFTEDELVSIAKAIGHPVRQIMTHL